jgi:uncharacterized membrane protein
VLRNSVSIAVLSMFGAFLAPAFALDSPDVWQVYGYFIAISQLTLIVIAARGWRPLIHLSFLFTLGGGLFFAWTQQFYTPAHFSAMRPLLLALTAIHLAMPLAEQRATRSTWARRFDFAYFILLPATAALSLVVMAPSAVVSSDSFLMLAGLWLIAALAAQTFSLDGVGRHALAGVVLLALGLFLREREWPWFLIGETAAAVTIAIANAQRWSRSRQDMTLLMLLFFTIFFVAATLSDTLAGAPFLNRVAIERVLASAVLLFAATNARKLEHPLSPLFAWLGALGLADVLVTEIYRLHIASWPMIIHGGAIFAAFAIWTFSLFKPASRTLARLAIVGVVASAWIARGDAGALESMVFLATAPLALTAVALRRDEHGTDFLTNLAPALLAPFLAFLWADHLSEILAEPHLQFALSFAALSLLITVACSQFASKRHARWLHLIVVPYASLLTVTLAIFTIGYVQRGTWPVTLEILCTLGLITLCLVTRDQRRSLSLYVTTTLGVALVAQAMLLRVLGPQGTLSALDLFDLRLPAVISLYWSAIGAALTLIARRVQSRSLWTIGAVVLVACAIKLVLLDFGSLGQLENILAVIAAGLVFLLVSWLAPPPSRANTEGSEAEPEGKPANTVP